MSGRSECVLCGCHVSSGERAWQQHVAGKRHQKRLALQDKQSGEAWPESDYRCPSLSRDEKQLQIVIEASLIEHKIDQRQEEIQMTYLQMLSTKEL